MKGTNPFNPTFGISPVVLAGRGSVLRAVAAALDEGIGSPGRASLIVGSRGSGKTVLLNEIEDLAAKRGWLCVSVTGAPGMTARLVERELPNAARRIETDDGKPPVRLKSLGAFGFSGGVEYVDPSDPLPDLRTMLGALSDEMGERGAGICLTVDEVQGAEREDLAELATAVQHLFRERRPVAVVFGGLPEVVRDRLLNDSVLTFLRRAERHHLGPVAIYEASDALAATALSSDGRFNSKALELAAEATKGYPFMIQLVGYHAWKHSGDEAVISEAHIEDALPDAQQRMQHLVLEPALADLSPTDRRFLLALSRSNKPSKLGEVASVLGMTSNSASQYRMRLLDAELISAPARGVVDISLPYLRSYLQEHGALGETLEDFDL